MIDLIPTAAAEALISDHLQAYGPQHSDQALHELMQPKKQLTRGLWEELQLGRLGEGS
jgi:hypothetical protein